MLHTWCSCAVVVVVLVTLCLHCSIATNTTVVLRIRDVNENPELLVPANRSVTFLDNIYPGITFFQFVARCDDFEETCACLHRLLLCTVCPRVVLVDAYVSLLCPCHARRILSKD
jgi:hypothetical protein